LRPSSTRRSAAGPGTSPRPSPPRCSSAPLCILGTLSLLVSGILVAVKRRVIGWQRWTVLVFGIGYLLLGFLQGGDEPTTTSEAAEFVQYLLLVLLAVAVRTATPTIDQPSTEPVRV
jgi:hypothetical protein